MPESAPGSSHVQTRSARTELELSESGLEEWAAELGRMAIDARMFVALYGPLGAGKSTLVRAACRAVGVGGAIPSPTFTLLNKYATPDGVPISHVDLYRIDTEADLLSLGWEELLDEEHPIFVEWAERAAGQLPERRWDVVLGIAEDSSLRTVRATPTGTAPDLPPAAC